MSTQDCNPSKLRCIEFNGSLFVHWSVAAGVADRASQLGEILTGHKLALDALTAEIETIETEYQFKTLQLYALAHALAAVSSDLQSIGYSIPRRAECTFNVGSEAK